MVEDRDGTYHVPPVLAFWLTGGGRFGLKRPMRDAYGAAIARAHLGFWALSSDLLEDALKEGKDTRAIVASRADSLRRALRQSFDQPDPTLQVAALSLASRAPGTVPLVELSSYAPRARSAVDSLSLRPRMANKSGQLYGMLGHACSEQRNWKEALDNYATAIQWKEKTGQHQHLGSTYHQIGRVHQEQRNWTPAFDAYVTALETYLGSDPTSPDIAVVAASLKRLLSKRPSLRERLPPRFRGFFGR